MSDCSWAGGAVAWVSARLPTGTVRAPGVAMTRAAPLVLAAYVLVATSARADPATADLRWGERATIDLGGTIATRGDDLGSSVSAQLEIAPKPWWYVSASAGIGRAGSFVGGAGLHLRWVVGPAALSAGVGALYAGVRDGTDVGHLLGDSMTTYHYPAIGWATAETALELRTSDNVGIEIAVGVAQPFAATAYTCRYMQTFGDVDSDCSGTVSGPAPYVAIRLNVHP